VPGADTRHPLRIADIAGLAEWREVT